MKVFNEVEVLSNYIVVNEKFENCFCTYHAAILLAGLKYGKI